MAQADDHKKYDIILKHDGQEMKGTITEITDEAVKFCYPEETVLYTVKKTGIQKITFANGRTEIISPVGDNSPKTRSDNAPPTDYQNKVAILPASVITDFQTVDGEISNRIQLACFNALSEKSKDLIFVSPNTTNALLLKQGISGSEINRYTMEELCQLLGVNYLVQTVATINTNAGFYAHAEASHKDDVKSITQVSKGATDYDTNIMLNIFDRDGKRLFGKDRTSIWHTSDGYQKTIDYLAKRTPLYKK
ncbi:hypothetical protein GCM10023231_19840 [Olivibacter ginsenosidimutans]|uniref:Uncharacterized protein n=1 Tax=Olivibacter ginsenosidimutans TaxID=1176537 RepID=A0ABP9BAH2_9SPHI